MIWNREYLNFLIFYEPERFFMQKETEWLLFTEGAKFSPAMLAWARVPARPRNSTLQTSGSQVSGGRAGRQETTGQARGCESQERVVGSKVIWFSLEVIQLKISNWWFHMLYGKNFCLIGLKFIIFVEIV